MDALAKANQVRYARADLKREMAARKVSLEQAMKRPCVRNMTIGELLLALPRYGPTRVVRLLDAVSISECRRICDLTERQRTIVVEALGPPPDELTEEHEFILRMLSRVNGSGPVLAQDVANEMGLTPGEGAAKLCALERRGLVCRCPRDRRPGRRWDRRLRWEMTDAGWAQAPPLEMAA